MLSCDFLPDLFAVLTMAELVAAIVVFVVTGTLKRRAAEIEGLEKRHSKLTYFPIIFFPEREETLALGRKARRIAILFAVQFAAYVAIGLFVFGRCGPAV